MTATPTLSIDSRKWAETIEVSGCECLCTPVTVKNVTHVLSTATVRGPQKTLCAAVANFVPAMLENNNGISVLTTLVCYGTPSTVEQIASRLLASDKDVWSFATTPKKELTKGLSKLLERLVYREDCTGDFHKALLNQLKVIKKAKLLSSPFTLPATGRLLVIDPMFAKSVAASTEAQKALATACHDAICGVAAEELCEIVFEEPSESAAEFVWKALSASLKPTAAAHPREAVLAVLAARAPASLVNQLADALSQWPNIHELCERDVYMQLVAHLLERADDEKAAKRLVSAVFTQEADVTERMNSRKAAPHRLLAALTTKPIYGKTLEKALGSSQERRLTAAKVRFANATQPKAACTQQAIFDKLRRLNASGAGEKRGRE